jgi:hypothetical protein
MATADSSTSEADDAEGFERPLPEYVDWLVALVVALGGMALTVGGSVLTFVVDRGLLAEGIESGQITVIVVERDLTQAEMLAFTLSIVDWTGIGLLVTGLGLVLFAVVYVVLRHRARQRAGPDETPGSRRSVAVLGAVATALLSFVPFSPVLGGALAGYLEQIESGRALGVGALSGLLAMLPAVSILLFLTVGLFDGLAGVGEAGLGIVVAAVMVIVMLFVAVYGTGLGALGGFIGGRLADDRS